MTIYDSGYDHEPPLCVAGDDAQSGRFLKDTGVGGDAMRQPDFAADDAAVPMIVSPPRIVAPA